MAGESAGNYAQRLRDKAARLERSAQMWERGAEGEKATAAALNELKAHGWTTFHDVRWPGRPRANIDHIAVGPGGVFVIDSKNWSGRIEVRDGVLRQNGRRREAAVAGVAEAAVAVTEVLGHVIAEPLICFNRDEPVRSRARGVVLCSTATMLEFLQSRPTVLTPDWIAWCAETLRTSLSAHDGAYAGTLPWGARSRVRTASRPRGTRRAISPSVSRRRAAQARRRRAELQKLIWFVVMAGALLFWLSHVSTGA